MTAAHLRPGLLVLAVLVGVAGLACARVRPVDGATESAPALLVVDETFGPSELGPVVGSTADRLRVAVRHDPAAHWTVVAALATLVAGAVVTIGGGVPAVPCRTTVHVRRRGPPSCV